LRGEQINLRTEIGLANCWTDEITAILDKSFLLMLMERLVCAESIADPCQDAVKNCNPPQSSQSCRQLVRFLAVKLTYSDSNSRFDMCVIFTANYSFSGRRRPRRQRDALGDRFCESQDQASSDF
jgi:hypothetical protein